MTDGSRFYKIRRGDRLGDIARRNGTTGERLASINGIRNPNLIYPGQILALSPKAALRVEFLVIDRDRNPVPGLKFRIEYCGRVVERISAKNGLIEGVVTDSPDDLVSIHVQRGAGSWKLLASVKSGVGTKRVTLTSPRVRIESQTRPHPQGGDGRPVRDEPKSTDSPTSTPRIGQAPNSPNEWRPPLAWSGVKASTSFGDPQSLFSSTLEELGIKSASGTQINSAPITRVTNDQVGFDFLRGYTGKAISEQDYAEAATKLNCQVAAIKAVAKVESGGKRAFDQKNRPVILFERHKFHKHTGGKYSREYPWLSSEKGYQLANSKAKRALLKEEIKAGTQVSGNFYGASSDVNYMRLAKAFALDKAASLKSCSWGKFQVLGEHAEWLGYEDVFEFVRLLSISESEHLDCFVRYVMKTPRARKGVQTLDWAMFASAYNGRNYKAFNYDHKMREAYELYSK